MMKIIKVLFVFLSLSSGNNALECWVCDNATSNKACKQQGRIEKCKEYQGVCQNEVRRGSFGVLITKRCKEVGACSSNFLQNHRNAWFPSQCNELAPNSVCRCCCNFDKCNAEALECGKQQRQDEIKPRLCPALEPPTNGELKCFLKKVRLYPARGRMEIGTECQFTCNPGYVMKGSNISRCKQRYRSRFSRFNTPAPTCIPITCSPPPPLGNGKFTCSNGNNFGSVCTYTCGTGYYVDGTREITCNNDASNDMDGSWSSNPGTCKVMFCVMPAVPKSGILECRGWGTVGTRCTFACNPGYVLIGESVSVCEQTSKRKASFNNTTPTCAAITCSPPPPLGNGKFTCSNGNNFGSVCTYTCGTGYYVDGTREITCNNDASNDMDGSWSSNPGTCKVMFCVMPAVPKNGILECRGWGTVGTRCTFACNPGYVLIGESVSVCKQTSERKASFNNTTPTCAGNDLSIR